MKMLHFFRYGLILVFLLVGCQTATPAPTSTPTASPRGGEELLGEATERMKSGTDSTVGYQAGKAFIAGLTEEDLGVLLEHCAILDSNLMCHAADEVNRDRVGNSLFSTIFPDEGSLPSQDSVTEFFAGRTKEEQEALMFECAVDYSPTCEMVRTANWSLQE